LGVALADGALPDFSALVDQDVVPDGSEDGYPSTPADTLPGVPGPSLDEKEPQLAQVSPTESLPEIPPAEDPNQTQPVPTPPPTVPAGERAGPGSKDAVRRPEAHSEQASSDRPPVACTADPNTKSSAGGDHVESEADAAGAAEQAPREAVDDEQLQKLFDELG
jgi:hypothetical protein